MDAPVGSTSEPLQQRRVIDQLRASIELDGGVSAGLLEHLAAVVIDDLWRMTPAGPEGDKKFGSLAEFIEAAPPYGLGSTIARIRSVVRPSSPDGVSPDRSELMNQVRGRLNDLLSSYPDQDPIARDARSFGAFSTAGGWTFGLMVARSVRKGGSGAHPARATSASNSLGGEPAAVGDEKVTLKAFAEQARCDAGRVSRYWRAWERAADAGIVPSADELVPGQEIPLPEADTWASYFLLYEATSDKHQSLAAEAEIIGTSYSKAVEITSNRPALRAAILGDPQTAAAARDALLERPEARSAVISQALADPAVRKEAAAETRRAERVEYVRRVLSEGKAKTPAGQMVDLAPVAGTEATRYLAAIQDPQANIDSVTEAYEFVQDLIADAVKADADILIHEERTKISKAISSTVKSIQAIDPDDFLAFADDTLINGLSQLQQKVNTLADLITRPS